MVRWCSRSEVKKWKGQIISGAVLLVMVTTSAQAATLVPQNYLLLRDKEPFLSPAKKYETAYNPRYLAAGDLNGDSFVDFVVPSQKSASAPEVRVHFNDGKGGLLPGKSITATGSSVLPFTEHACIADVDGDGDKDILVAHDQEETGGFSIIFHDGSIDPFNSPTIVNYLNIGDVRRIIAGEFLPNSGQGQLDIAVGINKADGNPNISVWRLQIYQNSGTGTFSLASEFDSNVVTGLDTADIDGNGHNDLLTTAVGRTGNEDGGVLIINTNKGTEFNPNSTLDIHDWPYEGKFADVDGDGVLDVIAGGAGIIGTQDPPPVSDNVTFIKGKGDGTFSSLPEDIQKTRTTAYKARGFGVADLNGDGKLDIVTASPGDDRPPPADGQDVRVLFGDNSGTFNTETMLVYDDYRGARGIALEDIDNDGDKDIIFTMDNNDDAFTQPDHIGILYNRM